MNSTMYIFFYLPVKSTEIYSSLSGNLSDSDQIRNYNLVVHQNKNMYFIELVFTKVEVNVY